MKEELVNYERLTGLKYCFDCRKDFTTWELRCECGGVLFTVVWSVLDGRRLTGRETTNAYDRFTNRGANGAPVDAS